MPLAVAGVITIAFKKRAHLSSVDLSLMMGNASK